MISIEGRHPGEFLLSEANFHRSRENFWISVDQNIQPGGLIAARANVAEATAISAVAAYNLGNATIDLETPPLSGKARNGTYRGTAIGAATVLWRDPARLIIGQSTHGLAFDGAVRFTLTAGDTPNLRGDAFTITVDGAEIEYVAFDPDADDGSDVVLGIALYPAHTTPENGAAVSGIVRDAEVVGECLSLPAGITAEQRAKAFADLVALGIIIR